MAFQLKPNRKESENKTIRFPLPLIEEIEAVITNQDVTFSSFVIQACEYALKNMDTSEHVEN
ncbi:MAG: YlcI/YnfO family protein [Ruminococcus sp.]|nr:YlcI/YnfO family protein [Ruminococcus sp.]